MRIVIVFLAVFMCSGLCAACGKKPKVLDVPESRVQGQNIQNVQDDDTESSSRAW